VIKIEHLESVGWEHSIRGMRNPLESWNKSDSKLIVSEYNSRITLNNTQTSVYMLGKNDLKLAKKLVKAGASHRKFLRHINIYCDITANEKWFAEFDTYLHTVQNSTSQMHSLLKKPFTEKDFSYEIKTLDTQRLFLDIIKQLNKLRLVYLESKTQENKKIIWRDILEIMPQSYLYTRTVMFNYEVFLSMYPQRINHKMTEWRELMSLLRNDLPYMDEFLTTIEEKKK